jgi:hypothetical protein
MRTLFIAGSALLAIAFTAACYTDNKGSGSDSDDGGSVVGSEGGVSGEGGVTTSFTFNKDIQPLLQSHCQTCHVAGGIAPMPLVTYQDAQTFAQSMKDQTASRTMPPWGARPQASCTPRFGWKEDPSLTDAQIAMLASWADGGAPEGLASDLKAGNPPAIPDLANATNKLKPASAYSLAGSTDQFHCFVLDPGTTSDMYMNGSHVLPGNPTIVHHVLVYSVPAGSTIPAQTNGGYDCFGGANITGPSNLIAAWAPGALPSEYPSDVGVPVAAGTKLVMQIHYHPHANANPAPDQTTFEMRLTATKPTYFIAPTLIGNASKAGKTPSLGLQPDPDDRNGTVEFRIPANSANHTETMNFEIPQAISSLSPRIYGLGAHMHLVGVNEQVSLHRAAPVAPDPTDECLLSVPEWDFNWQRRYDYATDISTLPSATAGDVMQVKCNYNNTMSNSALATSLTSQGMKSPIDVSLGESTLDEMCIANVNFIYKAP